MFDRAGLLALAITAAAAAELLAQVSPLHSASNPLSRQPGPAASLQPGVLYSPPASTGMAGSSGYALLRGGQMQRDLFSGSVQVTGQTIDPRTGEVRQYTSTTNPQTGTMHTRQVVRQQGNLRRSEVVQSNVTGALQAQELSYDPQTQTYTRRQVSYQPRQGKLDQTTTAFNAQLEPIREESSTLDLQSGRISAGRSAQPKEVKKERPPPYVWPPLDAKPTAEAPLELER